ncbi:chitinase-like protein Idgf1 [Striga asiatica]|uniref:Chitinase-like protein Idgf1 n=1 Tax=Striga asiatica TaxID=4170 RepID=A0A5A7QZ96_STRAF|nr:chitinase-like protein Idgf1 [Striga asiatica]
MAFISTASTMVMMRLERQGYDGAGDDIHRWTATTCIILPATGSRTNLGTRNFSFSDCRRLGSAGRAWIHSAAGKSSTSGAQEIASVADRLLSASGVLTSPEICWPLVGVRRHAWRSKVADHMYELDVGECEFQTNNL